MNVVLPLQASVAAAYLAACVLLLPRRRSSCEDWAVRLATLGLVLHCSLLTWRWHWLGQLPIVTRYEDLTVDSATTVAVYLLAQWRLPQLRQAGPVCLGLAGVGAAWALFHGRGAYPTEPSLASGWLVVHAELNSFAIAAGTLAAAVQANWLTDRIAGPDVSVLAGRLTAWTFLLWGAMLAAGSCWASLAWGRYWGWDPIESWSLATLLAYAFALHLRQRAAGRGKRWAVAALLPFAMMLFTTYGLLLVRTSVHGQYLFQ